MVLDSWKSLGWLLGMAAGQPVTVNVVDATVLLELAGFLWAEMTA